MKKASRYLKQLFSAIVAAVKARSSAVGSKATSLRTRLVALSIMRNKKLLASAIQSKINAIMGGAANRRPDNGGANRGEVAAGDHGSGGGDGHLLFGGSRKAAVLQSLPSFVVEQETRAVVLLSSLPSFTLDRDGDAAEEAEGGSAGDGGDSQKQQLAAPNASATELARAAAAAEGVAGDGEFRLEDEIDRVADVFIRRFHDQMKLQKLESFKRFCEMLERGA